MPNCSVPHHRTLRLNKQVKSGGPFVPVRMLQSEVEIKWNTFGTCHATREWGSEWGGCGDTHTSEVRCGHTLFTVFHFIAWGYEWIIKSEKRRPPRDRSCAVRAKCRRCWPWMYL